MDLVGRPRTCSDNSINMISVFTLMKSLIFINGNKISDKLSNFYFRSMWIKLVALRRNLYQEVALSFKKVGDPWPWAIVRGVTREAKGAQFPGFRVTMWAPNHCGGRLKVPTMSQVLSSIQYICFRKTSGSNMGAPNLLLDPRAI